MMAMPSVEPPVTPVTQQCMAYVAQQLQLPLQVLYAVLYTERGTPGKVSKNTNGTVDIGPMQINDIHLPFFERKYGWKEPQLRNNGCLNVAAGGILLRMQIQKAGGDIWKGIGNYHSKTPVHHEKYQWKVAGFLTRWGASNNAQPVQQSQQYQQAQAQLLQEQQYLREQAALQQQQQQLQYQQYLAQQQQQQYQQYMMQTQEAIQQEAAQQQADRPAYRRY